MYTILISVKKINSYINYRFFIGPITNQKEENLGRKLEPRTRIPQPIGKIKLTNVKQRSLLFLFSVNCNIYLF